MVERDTVVKEKIKFGGLAEFKEVYKFARDYFWKEEFNLVEDSYTEKLSGTSKELDIMWTAAKKITDYFKITLRLKWKVLNMSEVEVESNGQRKKMNKIGELEIEVKGILEKDYSSKWESGALQKFFKDVYNKYVIPQRTEQKEEQVRDYVQDFKE